MNLRELIERMMEDGGFLQLVNNPLSQFGPINQPFLGAEILPEQTVLENAYLEEGIRYRSVIANDGTRYSPAQLKQGVMTGQFQVILGESDIASEFTGQDYDALLRIIGRLQPGSFPSMDALASLVNWVDVTLNQPLQIKNELYRWQAIVGAQVIRTGDNGYVETVNFPNPSGHRIAAGGAWSDDDYDPYPDIINMAEFLRAKGFTINRMFAGTPVSTKLQLNAKMRARIGILSIASGTTLGLPGRLDLAALNTIFQRDNLPPLEVYNGQYRTQGSSGYFLDRASLVMVCTTGRDISVIGTDQVPIPLTNTLGYLAVGRPAGQSASGRALFVESRTNKSPRIIGEAWQTTGPVITEPEAIGVLNTIT